MGTGLDIQTWRGSGEPRAGANETTQTGRDSWLAWLCSGTGSPGLQGNVLPAHLGSRQVPAHVLDVRVHHAGVLPGYVIY